MNDRHLLINYITQLTDNLDTNLEYIEKYVEFCLTNRVEHKIKGVTSTHHILPQSKLLPFTQFKSLLQHPWNKAELKHCHHYYAHYLLAKAINHISTLTAFCGMHNKDIVLERITDQDLIMEDDFQTLYQMRNEKIRQHRLSLVLFNGVLITRAKMIHLQTDWTNAKLVSSERLKINNPVHNPLVVDKIRNTKSSTIIDGKNMNTISAERAAQTMKQEFSNIDGSITTIYKETGKKISNTVTEQFVDGFGNTTSIAKRRAASRAARYYNNNPMMCVIKNVFNPSYEQLMTVNHARRTIAANICEKTEDDYFGKHNNAVRKLKNNGKEHFIGLYAEKQPLTQPTHILDLGHTPNQ